MAKPGKGPAVVRGPKTLTAASPFQPMNYSILDDPPLKELKQADLLHKVKTDEDIMKLEKSGEVVPTGRKEKLVSYYKRISTYLRQRSSFAQSPAAWTFLILVGVMTAIVATVVDLLANLLLAGRRGMSDGMASLPAAGFFAGWIAWFFWMLFFGTLSGVAGHLLSKQCEGSGVPEMKSILSGSKMLRAYLSLRTLAGKIVGLVLAVGAGFSVGREGPLLHIGTIVADNLLRMRMFSSIRSNATKKRAMLAAGAAAGITATFGAPVGGVLFSIEVTAGLFQITGLWRGLISSVACIVTYRIFQVEKSFVTSFANAPNQFLNDKIPGVSFELIAFALCGLGCGLVAPLFVHAFTWYESKRKAHNLSKLRYRQLFLLALLTAIITFPLPFMRLSDREVVQELFKNVPLDFAGYNSSWTSPGVGICLLIYVGLKLFLTAISITMPIPCGLYTPIFAIGAAGGRFFGELLCSIFPGAGIVAGSYAVVGAASLACGTTHTLSTVVIVLELTGQVQLLIPCLTGMLVAYTVSGAFSTSAYSALMVMRGLPYLPAVQSFFIYDLSAKDMMHRDVPAIALDRATSFRQLQPTLQSLATHVASLREVPLVESVATMRLVGSVAREKLERAMERRGFDTEDITPPIDMPSAPELLSESEALTTRAGSNARFLNWVAKMEREALVGGVGELVRQTRMTPAERAEEDALYSRAGDSTSGVTVADEDEESGVVSGGDDLISFASPVGTSLTRELVADQSPLTVHENTPLAKVHLLFAHLVVSQIFVTNSTGRLVGVLCREDLTNRAKHASIEREAALQAKKAALAAWNAKAGVDDEEEGESFGGGSRGGYAAVGTADDDETVVDLGGAHRSAASGAAAEIGLEEAPWETVDAPAPAAGKPASSGDLLAPAPWEEKK